MLAWKARARIKPASVRIAYLPQEKKIINKVITNTLKGYKIYLDDERFPRTKVSRMGRMFCMFAELFGLRVRCGEWIIARNKREFISLIEKRGLPVEVSFDHDLGDNEPTGYDITKWMVHEKEYDLREMKINVHSANSVGRTNILGLIKSWNKFKNDEIRETPTRA